MHTLSEIETKIKRQSTIVRDARTLRMLERKGFIMEPEPSLRPSGKTWGRGYHYVDHDGNKPWSFWVGDYYYRITYFDGCFMPFVTKQIGS